ncbi:PQQ-dependent sugar dehydrogenase [Pendulispora rubella]|uniref:PQQ-dependent sugar dehydrogenase n=1 Tax=Pendulispora rubella TaxID=2741070 RepID=A0ABZ2LGS5_9BACT
MASLALGIALVGCKGGSTCRTGEATDVRATSDARVVGVGVLGHHEIRVADLPHPGGETATNGPTVIARPAGANLVMPEGFTIAPFAEGIFKGPRWVTVAPDGDVFVADAGAGSLIVLRDTDGDGRSDAHFTFATGQNRPFGLAFHDAWLYVANTDRVVRFRYRPGQTAAEGEPELVTELPSGGYNAHWTRNVAFNPEGTKLYVTVGSETNADEEPEPRASVLEMNPDGSGRRVFAYGTRNPLGLAFHPETRTLWAVVQERDGRGEDLVPDYATELKDGGFYGWPFGYMGRREDPAHRNMRPSLVRQTLDPDVLIQAHSATMSIVFYQGSMFPQEYVNDAFVALHGSWNRQKRTGYKLVRIRMNHGRPVGGYDDFAIGFMLGQERCEVWGRPVGLAVAKDGSLLMVDDGNMLVWTIRYKSP